MKKYALLLLGAALTFGIDQYTKWQILTHFEVREVAALIPGRFLITHVHNTGAAFGAFTGLGRPLLLAVQLLAMSFIIYFVTKIRSDQKIMTIALALIFGGALGNFFDRAYHGFVVDFIEVTLWGSVQWPTFNVADIAISVGVGVLVVELLANREHLHPAAAVDEAR